MRRTQWQLDIDVPDYMWQPRLGECIEVFAIVDRGHVFEQGDDLPAEGAPVLFDGSIGWVSRLRRMLCLSGRLIRVLS